jgi:hypothetical protein
MHVKVLRQGVNALNRKFKLFLILHLRVKNMHFPECTLIKEMSQLLEEKYCGNHISVAGIHLGKQFGKWNPTIKLSWKN